jgi:hypothetical protein
MVEVGEQTGALDNMLHKVGEFYDGEVENTVNNLTSLLEPILTVVMGSWWASWSSACTCPCSTTSSTSPQAETERPMTDDIRQRRAMPTSRRVAPARRRWPWPSPSPSSVTGMAYSLFWAPVVRHHPYWIDPGDLWATYRERPLTSGWGDLGGVYGAGTGLVTFPGILLALAPVAMLTGALGMTESFPKFLPTRRRGWYSGPTRCSSAPSLLFACDALAQRLGVGRGDGIVLCLAEAAVLWNVSVWWGHPEDAVAVGFASMPWCSHSTVGGRVPGGCSVPPWPPSRWSC